MEVGRREGDEDEDEDGEEDEDEDEDEGEDEDSDSDSDSDDRTAESIDTSRQCSVMSSWLSWSLSSSLSKESSMLTVPT